MLVTASATTTQSQSKPSIHSNEGSVLGKRRQAGCVCSWDALTCVAFLRETVASWEERVGELVFSKCTIYHWAIGGWVLGVQKQQAWLHGTQTQAPFCNPVLEAYYFGHLENPVKRYLVPHHTGAAL